MQSQDSLAIIWRRKFVIIGMALIGLAVAWMIGRPIEPAPASYGGEATMTLSVGEELRSVELYSYIAGETSQISSLVESDLSPETNREVEIVGNVNVGTLRISTQDQPSPIAVDEILGRYVFYINEYGTERRTATRDDELAVLRGRSIELRSTIQTIQQELEAVRAELDPDDPRQNRSIDPVRETELEASSRSLSDVLTRIDELQSQSADDLSPFEDVVSQSATVQEAVGEPLTQNQRLALGAGLGLLIGLGLAFVLQYYDNRVYHADDASSAYRLPVLAEIPKVPWRQRRRFAIVAKTHPQARATQAYRVLRSSLERARAEQRAEDQGDHSSGATTVLVTSVSAAVGKSTTVANLAIAAVDAGNRVLIVSADLRQPRIHDYLGVSTIAPGIAEAVADRADGLDIHVSDYFEQTKHAQIVLFSHGRPVNNPGETLAGARPMIEDARSDFDLILIDSPPMLAGNDVDELLPVSDLVIQVVRAGLTTVEEGGWARSIREPIGARTCGLVLVGSTSGMDRRSTARRSGWRARTVAWFSERLRLGRRKQAPSNWAGPTRSPSKTQKASFNVTREPPDSGDVTIDLRVVADDDMEPIQSSRRSSTGE